MMQTNVSKCKVMRVSRKQSNSEHVYNLNSTTLAYVDSYRYLGVLISNTLTWSDHITHLVADASKKLGYIRRTLCLSPPTVRKIAYVTFVRTKLEYASSIWSPHQTYLINLLESVQNRAARFIMSNYDHSSSITFIKESLDLQNLADRRILSRLCLFHKLYYYFPHLHGSLLLSPARYSRRLFNSRSLQRLFGTTVAFNKSFLPVAIEEWNNLPEAIVSERDSCAFKQLLTAHLNLEAH